MGDPRKARKKFETPRHPWEKERIEEEAKLIKKYGLKNKKEIQKMRTLFKNFKVQAKTYIADTSAQAEKEKNQLIERLHRLGLLDKTSSFDDVLALNIEAIFERRLQTIVFRKGLARTISQARQMITHRHIKVGEKTLTSPSAIIPKEDENSITFHQRSSFSDPDHPERIKEEAKKVEEAA